MLCGKYLGDNDATCPQLTCIRRRNHVGLCDNTRGDDDDGDSIRPEALDDLHRGDERVRSAPGRTRLVGED